MNRTIKNLIAILFLAAATVAAPLFSQNVRLGASSFMTGFAVSDAGSDQVTSTVGQPLVAVSGNGEVRIESGFLPNTLFRVPQYVIRLVEDDTLQNGQTGSDIMLSAPIGFVPTERTLFFRRTGEQFYQSSDLQLENEEYQISFPADYITERGVQYYILLSDGIIDVTYPPEDPEQNPAVARVAVDSLAAPVVFADLEYQMISVPLEMDVNDVFEHLTDDFGEYNSWLWRIFHWEDGDYVEYPDIATSLEPGEAFWIVNRFSEPFDIGSGLSVSSENHYEYILQPGWNQVGTPYAFSIDWASVDRPTFVEDPVFFDGSGYFPNIAVIHPWEGYWVYNNSSIPTTITVPPVESAQTAGIIQASIDIDPESEFALQFTAQERGSVFIDQYNFVGMRASAQATHDSLDFSEPPAIAENVQLSILEADHRFAGNFKPINDFGESWDIELAGAESGAIVDISTAALGALPEGFNRYIVDLDLRYLAASDNDRFVVQFTDEFPERTLRIITGTPGFAEGEADGIPLVPIDYDLAQNYPNPFNPETTIRYQVKRLSEVRLEVYNILGQRVKSLVKGDLGAGVYTHQWDGSNDAGNRVASGVYIYRYIAEDRSGSGERFMKSKKMVLVK